MEYRLAAYSAEPRDAHGLSPRDRIKDFSTSHETPLLALTYVRHITIGSGARWVSSFTLFPRPGASQYGSSGKCGHDIKAFFLQRMSSTSGTVHRCPREG